MAKDGTNRHGGARIGSGKKRKALADRIADGEKNLRVLPMANFPEPDELTTGIPPLKDYMQEKQRTMTDKDGKIVITDKLCTQEAYQELWEWLCLCHCENVIPRWMLDVFSMSMARYVRCQQMISNFGELSKHPTTGSPIQSPYVAMSRDYVKEMNTQWFQIFQLVKENSSVDFSGQNPQDDMMERLLRRVK